MEERVKNFDNLTKSFRLECAGVNFQLFNSFRTVAIAFHYERARVVRSFERGGGRQTINGMFSFSVEIFTTVAKKSTR